MAWKLGHWFHQVSQWLGENSDAPRRRRSRGQPRWGLEDRTWKTPWAWEYMWQGGWLPVECLLAARELLHEHMISKLSSLLATIFSVHLFHTGISLYRCSRQYKFSMISTKREMCTLVKKKYFFFVNTGNVTHWLHSECNHDSNVLASRSIIAGLRWLMINWLIIKFFYE